ncbi:MAG: tyrosine-type recombinase/integrase [Pseudomonadales bacterium]|nr:tyrosine-type recombinase/integrase [Pseudomonadales bacterium]
MARRSTTGKLTAVAVKTAKPKEKPYKLSDGGGMYILVNPNGSRYWRLKYRFNSKEKVLALGVYPDVSLADARKETAKAKELLENGSDPSAHKKTAKIEISATTFEFVALDWFEKNKGRWSTGHAKRVKQSLVVDVFPTIGLIPIDTIQAKDCLLVIRKIEGRGALDVAGRAKQRMSSIFRYAIYTGYTEKNPADALADVIQSRKVTHQAALPSNQLPAFLNAVNTSDHITGLTRQALRLIVLTFVRPGELRAAMWSEIDFEKQEWRIPAERMKMNEEHVVPLSRQSIEVLKKTYEISGSYEYVFPGHHNFKRPMSENTLTFAIRKRLNFDATAHGFRTVASTILNETGFRPDVIERQLAHGERNKVRAAYNQAQYLEDRTDMMQWWADYLDTQLEGRKVIPFRAKK